MYYDTTQIMNGVSIGIDAFTVAVSVILSYAIISEAMTRHKISQYYLGIIIANTISALADGAIRFINCQGIITPFTARLYDLSYIGFMMALMFFSFFQYSVMKKRVHVADGIHVASAIACIIPIAVWLVGSIKRFSWFYTIGSDGYVVYKEYFWVTIVMPILVLFFNFVFILSCKKELTTPELFAWISYEIFPLAVYVVYVVTWEFYESTIFASFGIALIFLYIQVHLHEIKENIETENELRKSQMKLMVSQIQPHFMYNALNSIYVLIDQDAEIAKEAVSTFSDYLRQNINSLKSDQPVEFDEELEHTKAYLYLEQIRFGDKLKILYDIKASNFRIPPLSVQPLVENAVKHGISKKAKGGTLKISSKEDGSNFVISIIDDGLGFDAGSFSSDDKHTHIGLFNVNSRLVSMVHGKLNVQSIPDTGTICTITIPKEEKS